MGLAFDRARVEYIEDPAALGFSVEELEELALANIRRIHEKGKLDQVEPGLWRAKQEDDFAAERILLTDVFDELGLDGDPVVFLAADDELLVCGAKDTPAIQAAFGRAAERSKGAKGLVDFALVRRGATWAPFVGEGELAETQELRVLYHLGPAYAVQHDLLAREGGGVVLGDFMVHATTGLSMTRWKKDVRMWLPRTSAIELDDGSGAPFPADWVAAEEAGAVLELVPNEWPERYETKAFPPAEGLASLRRVLEDEPAPPRLPWRALLIMAIVLLVALATARIAGCG